MKNYNILKPLKRKNIKHHSMIAVDFEDDGKGNFICAGVYGMESYYSTENYGINNCKILKEKLVKKFYTSQIDLNSYLLSLHPSNILVFFNLNYDKVYLQSIRDDSKTLEAKGRVIVMKLKNGISCIDLTNHVDGSLRDWMEYLNMKEKYGIVKVSLKNKEKRVMNDCKATYQLGKFLEDFYVYELGIPFMLTIGMQSLYLFKSKFFNEIWERKSFYNIYEREAYRGGRVEVFKRGLVNVKSFDINSCYLSIMRDCPFPNPKSIVYSKTGKGYEKYLRNYLGIFHLQVFAPKKKVMVLPVYYKGKLIFPCGTFSGYWTSMEINMAIKRGYKILKCFSFVYYREKKFYFRKFANYIWKKRLEYKKMKNRGMDLVVKKIGNALYGKFAQNNEIDGYFGKLEDLKFEVDDKTHKFQFYTKGEKTFIWIKPNQFKPAKFQFVCISAFMTSYARIKLLKAMLHNENSLVYCDTDSIKIEGKSKELKISNDLGDFQYEEKKSGKFQFYRPKFYGHVRKGVPKKAKMIRSEKEQIVYRYKKPLREREAIKRGLKPNFWRWITKVLTVKDDKRIWNGNKSEPIELNL